MTTFTSKVVLLDIEGTTTSISFVKDVLYPYAKNHTKAYLDETWADPNTQNIVEQLLNLPEFTKFVNMAVAESEDSVQNVANFVNYLIDKDLKLKPLKTLQGLVWEKGYANGDLEGHVYDDVPAAFKRWKEAGATLAIFSSGSIQAQKLLFGKTTKGDLLPFISAHYDTTIGSKQDQASYEDIAKDLNVECGDVLFLTDLVKEAVAAQSACMRTAILNRPGNAQISDFDKQKFQIVDNFNDLEIVVP